MPLGVGQGQNLGLRDFCHILTLLLPGASIFHKHMSCFKWCILKIMKHFIHKFLFSGNWGFTLPKCREIGSGQTGDPCQGSVWVRGNKGCGVRAARRPVRLYNPLQHRFGGDITSMLSLCHYVCSIVLITVTLIIRVTLFSARPPLRKYSRDFIFRDLS